MFTNHLYPPSFLHLPSAVSLFLAYLCPSLYGTAFERIFTSRCLCSILRQCRIIFILFPSPAESLRKYRIKCAPLYAELSPFNTSAQGAGQGPFQKGLRFLIERGVEGRLAFPPYGQTPFTASTSNSAESFLNRALLS